MRFTERIADWLALIIVVFIAICAVHAAHAQSVAMVTDAQGKVALVTGSERRELAILAELPEDARVELAQGARLVALYLQSGEEYTFTGPAAVRFAGSAPQTLSGAAPTRRDSALEKGKGIRIRPLGVTQAVVVMRSVRASQRVQLLNLAGTRTLDVRPEFRWEAIPGIRSYRFELIDNTGRSLLETDVEGETYRLPDTIKLSEGDNYTWLLVARLSDGRKYASSGNFSILAASRREEVEALRPASGAQLAERVAFAAWLDQQDLHDEARKYWIAAARERPDDAKLKQLAQP
jgi:hypothetical protein